MPEKIQLKVNGKNYRLEIDPSTPLLYTLRNNLFLKGPKYGCGMERCGSCMVLLNRKAMPSCMISTASAKTFEIETLESLGTPEKLHLVQKAFIDEQAAQCGYCMNGMIICATALLEQNPDPSDSEIKDALQRVLCRCGTHTRIIRAIKKAALHRNK